MLENNWKSNTASPADNSRGPGCWRLPYHAVAYIVAIPEYAKAIEAIRQKVGNIGDETEDVARAGDDFAGEFACADDLSKQSPHVEEASSAATKHSCVLGAAAGPRSRRANSM
jgi:hypothetical protein